MKAIRKTDGFFVIMWLREAVKYQDWLATDLVICLLNVSVFINEVVSQDFYSFSVINKMKELYA